MFPGGATNLLTDFHRVAYIDSLFLCVSAMTEAGLNTVNLSQLNTWQQVMLFLLIIIGSAIFVSSSILHIRKKTFENKFSELIERRRRRLRRPRSFTFSLSRKNSLYTNDREAAVASGAVRGRPIEAAPKVEEDDASFDSQERKSAIRDQESAQRDSTPSGTAFGVDGADIDGQAPPRIRFADQRPPTDMMEPHPRTLRRNPSFFEGRGVGARRLHNHPRHARPMGIGDTISESAIDDDELPSDGPLSKYLDTVNGYLGRNSQFYHLSERERKRLGGIEYE